ncbi:neuraminidase-like domain-containing protein [Nostoc sp. ChiQUE01b]|uniref:Tc toxin subunit A-related protein n=1 Tax=Nostoc sp. ChiQUE01b TaxID=3075376 RepID=UPI002AD591E7|nr:neuraminidase-like domain-containing protein [Nostoc sp. ChiQUE01b]MDZ8263102.1 neuraminidase-like domain-containing protein [Nostoc sp. ChiQUE01b]
MNLEGRNLQINMSGNDVRRLQTELRQLGFNLQVNGLFDSMTLVAVERFQRSHRLNVNGIVDEVTARRINAEVDALNPPPLIVKGHVFQADGDPANGVLVSAFDIDLRNEQILGQTQTDRQGVYQIAYTADQFRKREKEKADLVVKVLTINNTVLVASPILFNAPTVAEIDLTIPAKTLRPLPLFAKIKRELAPLLEDLRVEALEENQEHQDITFLAGETGFAKDILARYVLAHKLVPQGIQAEFWFVLLGSSFYEYTAEKSLADQLAAILENLPSLDAIAVRKALTRGFNQKEIAETFQANVDEWIEAFLTLVARREVTATDRVTFVKAALDDARIQTIDQQIKFARLFNQYRAFTPELLEELRRDSSFTPTEIADLDTSFQLADLTKGDFSVVKMVKQEFGVRQPAQIRTLAKRSEREWVSLVNAKHAAGDIKLPIEITAIAGDVKLPEAEVYGKMLDRQFREAFPTTAFTGGLERALQNGGTQGLRRAGEISRFLNRHESFELLNTPVDEFLQERVDPEFRELAADENFRLEVKAAQRVFKLAPTFEATDTLLADNLHSAQKVYRMGKSEFVRQYGDRPGFTPDTARLAWNRAADTHAAVLTIVADLKGWEAEALPMALKTGGSEDLSTFPNWNNLFKTGDLCECEHCRSVLSPAAYFADLLMFLKDRDTRTGNGKVKDVLFTRRPDLGFLELNCDNALVPLPYIDVVCEVLEAAINEADENDLELVGFTAIPADPVAAQTAITNAFQTAFTHPNNDGKQKIALGSNFSLSQVETLPPEPPDRWVVHTDDVTYLLKQKPPSPNFFAEILCNTKASADELRAYPQYVNPVVYDLLKTLRYPMSLPFDLFVEEVRAGFQKTNLQRWDLMRAFRGTALPNNPTNGDIAAEYFDISVSADTTNPSEKALILDTAATVAGQQARWGETDANWLTTVSNVRTFLHKTHLEYNELLALLDLKFINSTGNLTIQHLDASCDLDQKVIQGLDVNVLDRIHRFLRLWRKLKTWKMWELDLVIRHSGIGNGNLNEVFLINLFYFSEVKKKLGSKATVEQVCALFGDLNTETRFTKLHEKREDALYQNLFLNRRLINPLDPAFDVARVNTLAPTSEQISSHHPVVLAALGLREADLVLFKGLTKASDGTPYITDDLTLTHLSFLWRHTWLSKTLKFKAEEWAIILKIFQQDIQEFANPQAAWEFLEKIDHLNANGFKPDELNWLLAADRTAKAALKEADVARFLLALRKELQRIKAEYDPTQYDFLTTTPPTDVDSLTTLLTSLLQKLNRDEASIQFFLATLRDEVNQEAIVAGLPIGFTFPATITDPPPNTIPPIPIRYEPVLRFSGTMTDTQRTTLLTDALLAAVTGIPAYQQAIQTLFEQPSKPVVIRDLPADFAFPASITGAPNNIPILYQPMLRFRGMMTTDQQQTLLNDASLAAVTGIAAYQAAIDEFFTKPRLALKFFEPIFTVPLVNLPEAVDFSSLADSALAQKISYDAEQRLLRFVGIMSREEQTALELLSADADYRNAVNNLATQPELIAPPDDRIWLLDNDLQFPLRDLADPINDQLRLASNFAIAITKALTYLSKTLSEGIIIQQSSAQLGLTEALTRYLLTRYPLLPDTVLAHLTNTFATTSGVVDYATLKPTFDVWYWASRVATILKQWKITLNDLEKITALTAGAQLLDFQTLPLDDTGAIAPIDRFLRTSRLLKLRDSLPETEITLLEVLENLNAGNYADANAFAVDVERLNEDWIATDVESLIDSLDLTYPAHYLLVETWERLRRAFYFIDNLNAGADIVKTFAAAAMEDVHAKTLKELLRSKFGTETWLTLSAEIQDVLRERKRDALTAYLLNQFEPDDDPPSGKWENTNDLYAYYLLDVEMCSCQLTSRLVQGSGSIQLFVQRCFMGLEPDVVVRADGDDGDSAWHWWKWMRKYRVWEANRKVFLWPENWIEPELKKDKSSFFKDLENELLQNEINQYTVETAFANYLEKLDGVAQLEIAGFYQEDDGDNAIVHVFGRTTGAEPHLYYYRRYDYRQWTPWERVDLDIQGDYLIPAVVNKRLFLFWPVFTEVPDEAGNSIITVPKMDTEKESEFDANKNKTRKRLKLQLAVSDYRQGKWSPKKVSTDFYESESSYTHEINEKKYYSFYPIDLGEVNGNFTISFWGHSADKEGNPLAFLEGSFNISGCKGIPEKTAYVGRFQHLTRPEVASVAIPFGIPPANFRNNSTDFMKWAEQRNRQDGENDFAMQSFNNLIVPVLMQTPGLFRMSPPWHMSYFDKLFLNGKLALFLGDKRFSLLGGSWLPFFYNDHRRTFFVLPCFWPSFWQRNRGNITSIAAPSKNDVRSYYPEIKSFIRQWEDTFEGQIRDWLEDIVPELSNADRTQWEQFFHQQLNEEAMPPYSDDQFKDLATRWLMRFFHLYLSTLSLLAFQFRQFHFKNFYHPFVCDFAKLVHNPLKGIPALMSRETQLDNTGFRFKQYYQPTGWVVEPTSEEFYPQEIVDFTPDGAYSPYNWELFFHIPLLIANSLSKNQRFEEARDWYHFIFNPIGVESSVPFLPGDSPMRKYWITKPFFETTKQDYIQQRIENLLRMLAGDTSVSSTVTQDELIKQVKDWRTYPFEPHRIANYRTVAYQKTVVMKYLDNLIAWGDYLFRQDSMESINEATQLYILAAEILGSRPKKVPPQSKPPLESFNELETEFDAFSNALVEVENLVPVLLGDSPDGADPAPLPMLYFCIPQNDKMLGYWDTVSDRLYKIRNCMNIEGVVRQLALFEPPIDPGALVKAVAGGIDLSSALADLNAPLPLYRFNVLLQKANEVCNDVKALGSALLAALEKKDAEALSLLRQEQEIRLLEAIKAVREKQIEEAKENLEGLKRNEELITIRRDYYLNIEKINASETLNQEKLKQALTWQQTAQGINISASVAHAVPTFDLGISGFGGTPKAAIMFGGPNIGNALQAFAGGFTVLANIENYEANKASINAGHDRRWDDWKFQENLANKELEQIEEQIDAAELRIKIAEKELDNHIIQIENAKATDEFMRSKYTNEELYQWQIGQISGVYFQSYRLAYDLAKRAERCFRFELGLQDSSYIQFGYWDSLKKGLLSGEKLQYDLRRLETAYLEQHRREFELTKHISLTLLNPLALIQLRETGRCFVNLPEEIFDLDYPGHYFRRIKSVSITLPCVVGPYTTISCTLRLLKNSIRINTANGDNGYPRNTDDSGSPTTDDRFIENNIPVKAIAASTAQNDSGVFELSFRDERYLPFEGAGVISEWSLELFNDNNSEDFGKALRQFDYSTITDAILHIKYTAREDVGTFKNGAIAHLRDYFSQDGATPSVRMFNLRQEFPTQWHRFLNPTNPADENVFELEMLSSLFPLRDQEKTLKINSIWLLARCTNTGTYSVVMTPPLPAPPPPGANTMTLVPVNQYGGLHFSQKDVAALGIEVVPTNPPVKWKLQMSRTGGNLKEEVKDVLLLLGYEWEQP